MFKKLFVAAVLVTVTSACYAAEQPSASQDKMKVSAVTTVKTEIAGYKDLTKLQKAQMLVSHRSVEDEARIRKEAYITSKSDEPKTVTRKEAQKTKVATVKANKPEFVSKNGNKPVLNSSKSDPKYAGMTFSERLKTKYGIQPKKSNSKRVVVPKGNVTAKVAKPVKPVEPVKTAKVSSDSQNKGLEKQLQQAKDNESKLQKENEILKTEIKKNIAAMKKFKERGK